MSRRVPKRVLGICSFTGEILKEYESAKDTGLNKPNDVCKNFRARDGMFFCYEEDLEKLIDIKFKKVFKMLDKIKNLDLNDKDIKTLRYITEKPKSMKYGNKEHYDFILRKDGRGVEYLELSKALIEIIEKTILKI